MYYEIFKLLLFLVAGLIIFGYFIYFPPTEEGKRLSVKAQKGVTRFILILLVFFTFFGFKSFFLDIIQYIRYENGYLRKTECTVESVYDLPICFFAEKRIECTNGMKLTRYLTFYPYFKDEKFLFYYLPKSKMIVGQRILYSPFKKRMESK